MFKVNAYVTEIEPDNLYEVDIDGFTTAVAACMENDNGVVLMKSVWSACVLPEKMIVLSRVERFLGIMKFKKSG